jgi:hypothetical protein
MIFFLAFGANFISNWIRIQEQIECGSGSETLDDYIVKMARSTYFGREIIILNRY